MVSDHLNLAWQSCHTEPLLTLASRSSSSTPCPPAAWSVVLITHQLICFKWNIHKPLSLITANSQTKREYICSIHCFLQTLCSQMHLVFPSSTSGRTGNNFSSPESLAKAVPRFSRISLLHPFEGAALSFNQNQLLLLFSFYTKKE